MNALMPIVESNQIGFAPVQAVNGRDLHAFLQVPTKFKDWLPRRIREYRFEEGVDFGSYLSRSQNNRQIREYALTLGMAKVIAMLERSDRGQQARQFFMECERQPEALAAPLTAPNPSNVIADLYDPEFLKEVIARLAPRALLLEAKQEQIPSTLEPDPVTARKAEAFDHLTTAPGEAYAMTVAAKLLALPPTKFMDWLAAMKWIFRGADGWQSYQQRIEAGHLEHRLNVIEHKEGFERAHAQVRVTSRGLAKLSELLRTDPTAPLADATRAGRSSRRSRNKPSENWRTV